MYCVELLCIFRARGGAGGIWRAFREGRLQEIIDHPQSTLLLNTTTIDCTLL
jgi:hypothetical protein